MLTSALPWHLAEVFVKQTQEATLDGYNYLRQRQLGGGFGVGGSPFLFLSCDMWQRFKLALLWRAFPCQLCSARVGCHCNLVTMASDSAQQRLLSRALWHLSASLDFQVDLCNKSSPLLLTSFIFWDCSFKASKVLWPFGYGLGISAFSLLYFLHTHYK